MPGFHLYVDIHFGIGVMCMVFSALAVLVEHSGMYVYVFLSSVAFIYVQSCACQGCFLFFSFS